ncbi:hypothetical protein ACIRL3_35105 [Streptomyces sp. NPDC102384]|uniref:hypothetical protein n=1 Tax=Streptomyces sp. NPDC102384 TaxID=3366166 RepID=UPI0038098AF6
MTTMLSGAQRRAVSRLATLGTVTVVAGVVGAASAVTIIAWPDEVADRRYSYPFGATSYVVAQLFFALQHLGLLAGLYGLTRLVWPRVGRPTRSGLVLSLLGMVGLTACEVFALSATDALVDTARANAVDNSYGAPLIAIGLGMVAAGTGLARRSMLPGGGRRLVLVMGVYVFVVMFPAVFGPLAAGRIAVGVWMLMFAALGIVLVRADRNGGLTQ